MVTDINLWKGNNTPPRHCTPLHSTPRLPGLQLYTTALPDDKQIFILQHYCSTTAVRQNISNYYNISLLALTVWVWKYLLYGVDRQWSSSHLRHHIVVIVTWRGTWYKQILTNIETDYRPVCVTETIFVWSIVWTLETLISSHYD